LGGSDAIVRIMPTLIIEVQQFQNRVQWDTYEINTETLACIKNGAVHQGQVLAALERGSC
jgi:hypothetical protein